MQRAGLLEVVIGLDYKAALAVVPKVGAIFALAQVARNLSDTNLDWRILLAAMATVSMTCSNLAALVES
jgi:NADH-quinone oxidoreductase subunit N